MTKWLDENTIEGEMSNDNFIKEVMGQMVARVKKEEKEGKFGDYGNDGLVTVYEEKKTHSRVGYQLKVMRYFAVSRLVGGYFELKPSGMNKIGKHVVVESENSSLNYHLQEFLDLSEFLYHDTLHSGQEGWTLERQWEWANKLAKQDCERVATLENLFNDKVDELRGELRNWIKALEVKNGNA